MKKLISILLFIVSVQIHAQNLGFETGNLTGWSMSGGDVGISTGVNNVTYGGGKTWTILPYGSYMARLYPSGGTTFDSAISTLGLNSTENTAVRNFLSANSGGGSPTPTNASWIKTTITLQAGVTYSFAWNYLSTDYTPYNDGSMMTLTKVGDASAIPILNNSQQRYALLGFTNPGSGNYSTGSYGSTGWQVATFTVPSDGSYTLGFATFNLGDTVLSPMLFIDQLQGTTTLNGATFNPVPPNEGSTAPPPPSGSTLCCGGSSAPFSADPLKSNSVTSFKNRTTADSKVYVEQIGNLNTITIQQTGTKENYTSVISNGSFNTVEIAQTGTTSTQVNYIDLSIGTSSASSNSNNVSITQSSAGGSKAVFAAVAGSNNSLNILQKDSGSHWADVILTGGSKTVDITQQGTGNHMTKIELSGQPTTLNLTQSGSTQQFYSIQHNCATTGGCAGITVQQGQ